MRAHTGLRKDGVRGALTENARAEAAYREASDRWTREKEAHQAAEQTRILPHRVDRGRNALQLAAYRIFKNSAALLYPTVSVPK